MAYNYKQELKNIGVYSGNTKVEDIKKLYVEHTQIVDNIHNLWGSQKCFILEATFKGVSGSSWNHLMIVDYLEKLGCIKKVYEQDFSNHNVYILTQQIDIDQYDYIQGMLKEIEQANGEGL